jgi:hypothetical protein
MLCPSRDTRHIRVRLVPRALRRLAVRILSESEMNPKLELIQTARERRCRVGRQRNDTGDNMNFVDGGLRCHFAAVAGRLLNKGRVARLCNEREQDERRQFICITLRCISLFLACLNTYTPWDVSVAMIGAALLSTSFLEESQSHLRRLNQPLLCPSFTTKNCV